MNNISSIPFFPTSNTFLKVFFPIIEALEVDKIIKRDF